VDVIKKKKKRKAGEDDDERDSSAGSDWEEYQSELWEKVEPTFVISPPLAPPSPVSATITDLTPGASLSQRASLALEEAKQAPMEIQKPQRKQRMPREAKRDNDSKKNDLRLEAHIAQISSNAALFRTHLPGVISCPNKRYKAVVEIRSSLSTVLSH
jgi:hypothetical protein